MLDARRTSHTRAISKRTAACCMPLGYSVSSTRLPSSLHSFWHSSSIAIIARCMSRRSEGPGTAAEEDILAPVRAAAAVVADTTCEERGFGPAHRYESPCYGWPVRLNIVLVTVLDITKALNGTEEIVQSITQVTHVLLHFTRRASGSVIAQEWGTPRKNEPIKLRPIVGDRHLPFAFPSYIDQPNAPHSYQFPLLCKLTIALCFYRLPHLQCYTLIDLQVSLKTRMCGHHEP
jgi:hypothetical protein